MEIEVGTGDKCFYKRMIISWSPDLHTTKVALQHAFAQTVIQIHA